MKSHTSVFSTVHIGLGRVLAALADTSSGQRYHNPTIGLQRIR